MVAKLILRLDGCPLPLRSVRHNVVFQWTTWVPVLGAFFLYGDDEDRIVKMSPGKLDKEERSGSRIVNEALHGV